MLSLTAAAETHYVGQFAAYFDEAGSVRSQDSPGEGVVDSVWIYAEDLAYTFISGVQYGVDYGPHLQWIADFETAAVTVGQSPTGIAMGFGIEPRPAARFLIQIAVVKWMTHCAADNVDGPTVIAHPQFSDDLPAYTSFPYGFEYALGARSQTCQDVGLDIRPGSCSNPLRVPRTPDDGVLPVAILGSPTVDVHTIDAQTIRLEEVSPLPTGQDFEDVASLDENLCADEDGDGWVDLTLEFSTNDIAVAIGTPAPAGELIPLTLTGAYSDGMPFSATDIVKVAGKKLKAPSVLRLRALWPNPARGDGSSVSVMFELSSPDRVALEVYDVAGRLVGKRAPQAFGDGDGQILQWNTGSLASGVYFVQLISDGGSQARAKLTVVD